LEHLNEAIKFKEESSALLEIATVHEIRGEAKRAQNNYLKCCRITEIEIGVSRPIIDLFSNEDITQTSNDCDNFEESMRVSLETKQQRRHVADSIYIYGIVLKKANMNKKALICFEISLKVYRERAGSLASRIGDITYQKGHVLLNLGRYHEALESLKESIQIRRNVFGGIFNERVSETLKLLGECESELGNADAASELLEEIIQKQKVKKSSSHHEMNRERKEIQNVLLNLGKLHQKKGDFATAHETYRDCLRMARKTEVETNSFVGESYQAIGQLHFEGRNYFRALLSFEQAFSILKEENDDEKTCNAMINMGELYFELGRLHEALNYFNRCLELMNSISSNPSTITTYTKLLRNLGATNFRLQCHNDAKVFYKKIIQNDKHGKSKDVATCWWALADIHFEEQKYDDALSYYQKATEVILSIPPDSDANLGKILHKTGKCFLMKEKYDEAIITLMEAFKLKMDTYRDYDTDDSLADVRCELGFAWYKLEGYDLALDFLSEGLTFKVLHLDAKSKDIDFVQECIQILVYLGKMKHGKHNFLLSADSLQKRGICEALQDKTDKAIQSHLESLRLYKRIHGANHIVVSNALFNIGVCMNDKGTPEEAIKLFQKAITITKTCLGEDHLDVVDILHQMAISYRLLSNTKEARVCLDEAIVIFKHHSQHETVKASIIMELISDIAIEQKSKETAKQYLSEALRIKNTLDTNMDMSPILLKLSTLHMGSGHYAKAINLYERCLMHKKIFFGDIDTSIANIYLSLGIAHNSINNFDKALICFDICANAKNIEDIIIVKALTNRIDLLLQFENCDDEASECLKQALNKTGESVERAQLLVFQGQILERFGKYERAINSYDDGVSMFQSNGVDSAVVTRALADKARILLKCDRVAEAESCLDNALHRAEGCIKAELLVLKGEVFDQLENTESALNCYEKALAILSKHRATDPRDVKSGRLQLAKTLYLIGCIQGNDANVSFCNYQFIYSDLN